MSDSFKTSLRQQWTKLREYFSIHQGPLFQSVRLKLTGFYLAVLIIFSLFLTLSVRTIAEHEFSNAGAAQRGVVRNLIDEFYSVPPTGDSFNRFQANQTTALRQHLNGDVIIINLCALVVGGILSYWYAGRALKPVEEAHETQARFAADASHELRTPLANLRVENEVFLRQKKFTPDEARKLINSNLEEVQRLESLSGNLLAITQYEKASLSLNPVRITPIVEAAVERAQKNAEAKTIKLNQAVPAHFVLGDSDSLSQLVGIVLDNAIKYSPKGSEVFIDGIKNANRYHLSIRDQGPGISEADLPYIFDRLYRGDKSRTNQTPGYGLGLSLAREIARANKSSITVRNYPSGGAQFVISLSLAKVS